MGKTVLIASNTIWSIWKFREELIRKLANDGYIVHTVGGMDKFPGNSWEELSGLSARLWKIKVEGRGISPLSDLILFWQLFKIYKRLKPDVVLNFTPKMNIYGGLVCRILKIDYIPVINGLGSGMLKQGIISYVMKFMYTSALKGCPTVVFQNISDLEYFVRNGITPKSTATIIKGSGVNLDTFNYRKMISTPPVIFIFIGRLLKDKGIMEYLKASSEIISEKKGICKFHVAGYFDHGNPSCLSESEIDPFIRSGAIEFLGYSHNVPELIGSSTVVVLPSYREGMSKLLLEAASSGRPIIASDVPGCRELVKDRYNGFLCEPHSVASLKSAMLNMLGLSQQELVEMGERSRRMIEKEYDARSINHQYLFLINSLCHPLDILV